MVLGPRDQAKVEEYARTDYRESEGFAALRKHYADEFDQGWKFHSNFFGGPPTLKEREATLRELGYEIFVGDVTFAPTGRTSTEGKVILKRKIEQRRGE